MRKTLIVSSVMVFATAFALGLQIAQAAAHFLILPLNIPWNTFITRPIRTLPSGIVNNTGGNVMARIAK